MKSGTYFLLGAIAMHSCMAQTTPPGASAAQGRSPAAMGALVSAIERSDHRLQALTADTTHLRRDLDRTLQGIEEVKKRLDKDFLYQVGFGVVSDQVNWFVRSVLGQDKAPTGVFWLIGASTLLATILSVLGFLLRNSKPDGLAGRFLTPIMAWVVCGYLGAMSLAMLWLAYRAPESPSDVVQKQIEASQQLTKEFETSASLTRELMKKLDVTGVELNHVRNALPILDRVVVPGAMADATGGNLELVRLLRTQSSALDSLKTTATNLRREVQDAKTEAEKARAGFLWRSIVLLGGLSSLIVVCMMFYLWRTEGRR